MKMARFGRFLCIGGCLIAIILAGGIWWAGNEIASPARRPVQDYHTEFLRNPTAHGTIVKPFMISDGTPCLLMEPLPTGQLGPRGAKLREQLEAEKIALLPSGEIIGTLVLIHGRKGRQEDYLLIGERFCAAGFRCLLPDMPGHGDHPARLVTFGIREGDLPAQVLHEASMFFQFPPQPAGLLGISMGGAVAIHAAAKEDAPWKTLVIISSFDRLDRAIEANVAAQVGSSLGHLWQLASGWIYEARTGIPSGTSAPIFRRTNYGFRFWWPMALATV